MQTYTVLKGKYEEHDEQTKKFTQYISSKFGKTSRHFQQRHGPIGARVTILEFKDNDEYLSFWDKFDSDEKAVNFRNTFIERIDPASWRALFWNEIALE